MPATAQQVELDYQWTDYQKHVREELETGDHDLVVLRTGYGGGKTICGAQWIHRGAVQDRAGEGESLVMAQDYEKGKSTTYSIFFKCLPGEQTNPFKDGDPENSPIVTTYNQNDKRLVYITGHTAWLGGADHWSRFAGGEFARIWCDEVAHYPDQNTDLYKLYEMLVTRQRTDVGPNTTLWTSTGNGYNAFYDITERRVDPDDNPLPWADRMTVVVASTEHNRLLPDDGLEKIRNQFQNTERAEQGLHGGFSAAEGLVYQDFSRERHVIPEAEAADRISGDWRIYGYDHGWNDPRVVVEVAKTAHDQYLVADCFYETEVPYERAVEWLRSNGKPEGTVYAETEPEHQEAFRAAGYPCEGAIKDLDEGISEVRSRLERDSEGRPGLLVSDRCTPLIQEFLSYKEEHVGKSVAEDHALDSLRYCLMGDNYDDDDGGQDAFLITS